jgi:hypothetical protein
MIENVGVISGLDLSIFFEIGIAAAMFAVGFTIGLKKIPKIKLSKTKDLNYWKLHSRAHEILTELRIVTKCARTQIVQFHNGEYFMDGLTMRMKTLTHESLASGVAGEGKNKQRLQLSMFIPLMKLVIMDDGDIHKTNDLEESYAKQHMRLSNVLAFSVLPLKKQGSVIGYVMCQWCSETKMKELKPKQICEEITLARDKIEVNLDIQRAKI